MLLLTVSQVSQTYCLSALNLPPCSPKTPSRLQAVSGLQKELEVAYQRASRAEADAADARRAANRSATLVSEMERLTEENVVLGHRFDEMAGELKWVCWCCLSVVEQ